MVIWSFFTNTDELLDSAFSLPIRAYYAFPAAALPGNPFGCYLHSFQIKTQRFPLIYTMAHKSGNYFHTLLGVSIQKETLIPADKLLMFPLR